MRLNERTKEKSYKQTGQGWKSYVGGNMGCQCDSAPCSPYTDSGRHVSAVSIALK